MELREYAAALRRGWLLILVATLVGGLVAAGYTTTLTSTYRSTGRAFVTVNAGGSTAELVQGSTFLANSIQSFVMLADQPVVLEPVIAELGLETTPKALSGAVTATNPLNTYFIDVSVVSASPQRSSEIANAVLEQLAVTVTELAPTSADGNPYVNVTVVAPATTPSAPFAPNKRLIVFTGVLVGLVVGVLLALLVRLLDTRVRTSVEVQSLADVPLLGTIGRTRSAQAAITTITQDPRSPRAEEFRRLQTNLQYLDVDKPPHIVVVSSATPQEGKTSMCTNLALAVAEKNRRVLLIDADLRRPMVADRLGLLGAAGLTTVLVGGAEFEDVIQPYSADVDVLASGEIPPNPSQLLDSNAMQRLLDRARAEYDFIVIDSPPILPVVDASVLARRTDGMILVVRLGTAKRTSLQRAAGEVRALGADLLGSVTFGEPKSERTPSYYGPDPTPTGRRGRRKEPSQHG